MTRASSAQGTDGSPAIDEVVARLAERVGALEDELAITRLLSSYGFAVDGDDADGCADLYAPDAVVTIDDNVVISGREELRTIVTCDAHQAILPGCAHVMGPFVVEITGNRAVATGYATVFIAEDGGRQIWRQSFGRWELSRQADRWQVDRRSSWAIGRPEGQESARRALRSQLGTSTGPRGRPIPGRR